MISAWSVLRRGLFCGASDSSCGPRDWSCGSRVQSFAVELGWMYELGWVLVWMAVQAGFDARRRTLPSPVGRARGFGLLLVGVVVLCWQLGLVLGPMRFARFRYSLRLQDYAVRSALDGRMVLMFQRP